MVPWPTGSRARVAGHAEQQVVFVEPGHAVIEKADNQPPEHLGQVDFPSVLVPAYRLSHGTAARRDGPHERKPPIGSPTPVVDTPSVPSDCLLAHRTARPAWPNLPPGDRCQTVHTDQGAVEHSVGAAATGRKARRSRLATVTTASPAVACPSTHTATSPSSPLEWHGLMAPNEPRSVSHDGSRWPC